MTKTELYKLQKQIEELNNKIRLDDFTLEDIKYAILNALEDAPD